MKIILASTSENRRNLLNRMNFQYEAVAPDYEEHINPNVSPRVQVETFALGKAMSVWHQFEKEDNVLVLGFDSMIEFEGGSIGKAPTKKAAFEMLQKFVGNSQRIITGTALVGKWKGKYFERVALESTEVTFRDDITNCQIRKYLTFGDWKGKCGAYSILGTGIFFLKPFTGDFQNIVGIPVIRVGEMIREVTGKSPFNVVEPPA